MVTSIEEVAVRTASEIGLAFRSGEADPLSLTEYLLDRIKRSASSNIFITVTGDRAKAEARESAKRYKRARPLGPLDGVPLAWKDLFDVAGSRTTAASALFRDSEVKRQDLKCVAFAASAGMVCLGKLNMTEFAYSGLGLNPHFGTPVNPNDTRVHRSPGGSSSGSGAVIAAGLAPCAVGTDTGGSVRIPASLNGVYGYKTSEGRIDKEGLVPLSRTLDSIGPLGRSVEDCVLMDMVLRGAVSTDVRHQELSSAKIVVPENFVLDGCAPAILENFELCLRRLEKAGARIERRRIPEIDEANALTAAHGTLTAAESYHEYSALIESKDGNKMDPRVVHRIMQGGRMSANDLLCIQETRRKTMTSLAASLGDALIAMPTTPITAPEIAPLEADMDLFHEVNLNVLKNTMVGSFLGFCGLAIPSGRDENHLPTSILFSALRGRDDFLLGLGLEIDRVLQDCFEPTWTRK